MNQSRTIKVFISTSLSDLGSERKDLVNSLSQDIGNLFEKDNVSVRFISPDDIVSWNEPFQESVERSMQSCDVSLFLLKQKVGKYTIQEFEVARGLQKKQKHKVFVYFLREIEEKKEKGLNVFRFLLDKEGIYVKECESISEVKFSFAMEILNHIDFNTHKVANKKESHNTGSHYNIVLSGKNEHRIQKNQDVETIIQQVETIMEKNFENPSTNIDHVVDLYKEAVQIATKSDYDKELFFDLLSKYALILIDAGLFQEAETVYLRQLPIAEELYGAEHENTASLYNNLGSICKDRGNYIKALDYYNKALKINEKILGKEHLDSAMDYNNIGLVYDTLGDYQKALEYYSEALSIREKLLGEDHPGTATSYNNIGSVYYSKGDYSIALRYYKKALAIQERFLGSDHYGTTNSYNNIGSTYCSQGEYSKALEYYCKALAIQEKVLDPDHPDTANSYNNIGMVYLHLGDYTIALEYYFKALEIREKVLGTNHPDTANSYNNIGMVYLHFGDFPKALKYYFKALAIQEKVLGKDHLDNANSYNNIGVVYYKMENYEKALGCFNNALGIRKSKPDQLQFIENDGKGIISIRQKSKHQLNPGTKNSKQWLTPDKNAPFNAI